MQKVILATCFVCWALTVEAENSQFPDFEPLSDEMIDYINNEQTTWTAARTSRFKNIDDMKRVLGVKPGSQDLLEKKFLTVNLNEIPDNFDARDKWPNCPTIQEIRDQGNCGSCWVFGAVESMSDRICIASNGKVNAHLSADDLLNCCLNWLFGCHGGIPSIAWLFWVKVGIVTGGNYGSKQGCLPYSFPPSKFNNGFQVPSCITQCQAGYNVTYEEDKHYGLKAYRLYLDVPVIQTEIMTHGPVEASFAVFSDFFNYKSGVYKHIAGSFIGLHAVKMIGWGVENGTPYWLCANSWNSTWGDQGLFKILRGNNEVGIELDINAGIPKL